MLRAFKHIAILAVCFIASEVNVLALDPGCPESCNDWDVCTHDSCDPQTHACTNTIVSLSDDDHDGVPICYDQCIDVDDAILGTSCSVGIGECKRFGANVCTVDFYACNAKPGKAHKELCNGLDDDCDGKVDEGSACPCDIQNLKPIHNALKTDIKVMIKLAKKITITAKYGWKSFALSKKYLWAFSKDLLWSVKSEASIFISVLKELPKTHEQCIGDVECEDYDAVAAKVNLKEATEWIVSDTKLYTHELDIDDDKLIKSYINLLENYQAKINYQINLLANDIVQCKN